MRAYRFLCEDELKLMLSGNKEALGRQFEKTPSNTHKYKKEEKYIHFFLKKENCIKKAKGFHKTQGFGGEKYIAEFNIPLSKILGHIGRGFYTPETGGYDYYYETCFELVIPVSIFNLSWLKTYEKENTKIETKNIQVQPE